MHVDENRAKCVSHFAFYRYNKDFSWQEASPRKKLFIMIFVQSSLVASFTILCGVLLATMYFCNFSKVWKLAVRVFWGLALYHTTIVQLHISSPGASWTPRPYTMLRSGLIPYHYSTPSHIQSSIILEPHGHQGPTLSSLYLYTAGQLYTMHGSVGCTTTLPSALPHASAS